MHIDEQIYKRMVKRLGILEDLAEVQTEIISGLIRAIQLICKRLPRAAGSADPFDLLMMDPFQKPYVLPPGLAEELNNPVWKWAVANLSHEEAEEYHRRTRLIWLLREMRSEREARNRASGIGKKSPGGGSPGATDGKTL